MKVLLTSVSAGSGHVRAAQAVQAAFWRRRPDVEAVHVDVMDFVDPAFRRLYTGGYSFAVNHAPALWGRFYSFWDQSPAERGLAPWLRRAQRRYAAAFFHYLSRLQPDLIVSTHFLVPQLLAEVSPSPWMRRIPVECVVTDYDLHRFWISPNITRYYVAHEELAQRLAAQGVPSSRIVVSGIPVHPVFLMPVSPAAVYRNLQLDPATPVVLVLAGGLGLTGLEQTVKALFTVKRPVQIVAVAGRSEVLRERLGRLSPPPHVTLVNLGYVRNMHELLSVSDVVVTKPGGLTVSECLAKRKPMLLCAPIPGQEERNADYALRRRLALVADRAGDVPVLVERMLSDTSLRRELEANLAACARPDAAFQIAESAARTVAAAA